MIVLGGSRGVNREGRVQGFSRLEGVHVHGLLADKEVVDEWHETRFGISQKVVDLQSDFLAFVLRPDISRYTERKGSMSSSRSRITRRPLTRSATVSALMSRGLPFKAEPLQLPDPS